MYGLLLEPTVTLWDERYAGTRYYYGTAPNDFLRGYATSIPRGGTVL